MGSMGHFLLQVPGCLYLGHALARQILRVYVIGREINQSLLGYERKYDSGNLAVKPGKLRVRSGLNSNSTARQPEFERDGGVDICAKVIMLQGRPSACFHASRNP